MGKRDKKWKRKTTNGIERLEMGKMDIKWKRETRNGKEGQEIEEKG